MNVKTIVGVFVLCVAAAHADFTNGLVAYYPFSGNANDASGNAQHGVVTGATLATDRFGNSTNSYSFNGIDNYISAVITNLPSGDPPRTMPAWLMPVKAVVNSAMLGVVGYGAGTSHTLFGLNLDHGQTLSFWGGNADFSPKLPAPLGMWSFVAVTYSDNTIEMMVNGVVAKSESIALETINSGKFFFGVPSIDGSTPSWPAGSWDKWFGGCIDDVRLYNRALSTSEVEQLYAYEAGPQVSLLKAVKPSFSNLVIGINYQLQLSPDLDSWTDEGDPFTATDSSMVYPQYWDVENWNDLYFRLAVVP